MATDQDAWECDLAETYGVIDWEQLSVRKLAVLSSGLRDNSRIKMKLSGSRVSVDTYLIALMADSLSWLVWAKTKDAQEGKNRPMSIASLLMGTVPEKKQENSKYMQFDSGADFSAVWAELATDEGGA